MSCHLMCLLLLLPLNCDRPHTYPSSRFCCFVHDDDAWRYYDSSIIFSLSGSLLLVFVTGIPTCPLERRGGGGGRGQAGVIACMMDIIYILVKMRPVCRLPPAAWFCLLRVCSKSKHYLFEFFFNFNVRVLGFVLRLLWWRATYTDVTQ